jgi:hypothetical protein
VKLTEIGNTLQSADGFIGTRDRSAAENLFLLLLAVLTAFVVVGHLRPYATHGFVPEDFGAFYCAGKVVLLRQDPYRVEPLLDCERHLTIIDPRWEGKMVHEGVNAAPLPGYDFIPLAALAALPTQLAVTVFGLLLLCVTAVTGYCLARMSPLPPIAAFAIAFVGITYGAAPYGQLAPFAIAAVAAAALLLRLGKQRRAALVASVALIQPLFGLPILVATFLFVPRTRLMIGMIVVALVLCSVAAVGMHGMIEYPSVLSIHARAELNAPFQYSLTWLIHAFGGSATIALLAGSVSYIVFFAICLLVLARTGEPAIETGAIVLLPAAFSVFGGAYVHIHQISVALLAAIVLAYPTRIVLGLPLAAALLTVPFPSIKLSGLTALPSLLLMVTAAWCVVFFQARASRFRAAATSASVIATLIIGLIALSLTIRPPNETTLFAGIDIVHNSNAIASIESEEVNDIAATRDRTPLSYYLLRKLPTWCGVAITLWCSSSMLLSGAGPLRKPR